jgi:hypothetical protein
MRESYGPIGENLGVGCLRVTAALIQRFLYGEVRVFSMLQLRVMIDQMQMATWPSNLKNVLCKGPSQSLLLFSFEDFVFR